MIYLFIYLFLVQLNHQNNICNYRIRECVCSNVRLHRKMWTGLSVWRLFKACNHQFFDDHSECGGGCSNVIAAVRPLGCRGWCCRRCRRSGCILFCCCCFFIVIISIDAIDVTMAACRSMGRQIAALSKYSGSIRLSTQWNHDDNDDNFSLNFCCCAAADNDDYDDVDVARLLATIAAFVRAYYLSFVFNLFMATVSVLLIMYIIIAVIASIILMEWQWVGMAVWETFE